MTDPRAFSRNVTLKNGLAVTIRALRPEDRDRVAEAVRRLDRESIYTRLFAYRKELTEAGLDRIMHFDPEREIVLLAITGEPDSQVIGSARYVVLDSPPRTAEVAFVVEEDFQGLGIAGRLLASLAEVARTEGLVAFEADVLKENRAMLGVFERSGLPMSRRPEGGSVHVSLQL